MDTSKKKLGSANPVRFTEQVEGQIDQAARALGLAKQDVIRMACAIGLRQLEEINYDIAGAVLDKAQAAQGQTHFEDAPPQTADDRARYRAKRRSA